jgi:mono/diheme cytochrome c family protein
MMASQRTRSIAIAVVACAAAFASAFVQRTQAQASSPHADANVAPASPAGTNRQGLAIVKNPYTGNATAIAEGEDLFTANACSSCHGVAGAGGMCPPLVNDAWVYGSDDTTLFNLIKLGSVQLRAKGYVRGDREKVAGDMPPFGGLVGDDEAWRLIAYIRSKYAGDPKLRDW